MIRDIAHLNSVILDLESKSIGLTEKYQKDVIELENIVKELRDVSSEQNLQIESLKSDFSQNFKSLEKQLDERKEEIINMQLNESNLSKSLEKSRENQQALFMEKQVIYELI